MGRATGPFLFGDGHYLPCIGPRPRKQGEMPVSTKELWNKAGEDIRAERAQNAPARTDEVHPADDQYVPPVTTVKLPSRGVVYPPESPLYMLESIDIKSVSAKEENILANAVLIKKGVVLSVLMRACITNRMIDPDLLLVGDRNAILTAIRVSAYGPNYSVEVECPKCGKVHQHTFDLSVLRLKMLDASPTSGPGSNRFSFKLPVTGREVQFRLHDGSTAAALDVDIEAVKEQTGQEQGVTMRLMSHILSVSGIPQDARAISKFVEDMPARDAKALRNHIASISPGVDMTQSYECKSCGSKTEVDIPIGTEFFWPTDE